MKWYKSLNIHAKINAKNCFQLLTGTKFGDLSFLFSFEERINIMYNKLKIEGFEIE
jgi:hypothetical protein